VFEKAITPEVLLLIETLSKNDEIVQKFYLAGGTALALHLGHRISKDIDLFCKELFNLELYSEQIVNMKEFSKIFLNI